MRKDHRLTLLKARLRTSYFAEDLSTLAAKEDVFTDLRSCCISRYASGCCYAIEPRYYTFERLEYVALELPHSSKHYRRHRIGLVSIFVFSLYINGEVSSIYVSRRHYIIRG